ncbi:MAG: DUF1223 domain-containing protein [Candidatus Thiodiazotropha endolucinida]
MNGWRGLLLSVGLMAAVVAQPTQALTLQSPVERVNLLELYTSHGCSSCPPADAWLRKLERHPGLWQTLIPVAFHVDYWDDLGWPDRFASPAFSNRQRDHRRQGAIRSVYTPGFVLNGQEWRQWFYRPELDLPANEQVGRLTMQVDPGTGATLKFLPQPHLEGGKLEAHFAILGFGLSSRIGGGENRGRTLEESFVVLSHQQAASEEGEWRFTWPELSANEADRLAVVAWLTRPDSSRQVQAAGGWLP